MRRLGYDLVYYKQPSTYHRYPYGNLLSFLEDIKSRGFKIENVVDVGANNGDWSRDVSQIFPNARSLLIEPQQALIPRLKALCGG